MKISKSEINSMSPTVLHKNIEYHLNREFAMEQEYTRFDKRVRDVILTFQKNEGEIEFIRSQIDRAGMSYKLSPSELVEQIQRFASKHAEDRSWMSNLKRALEFTLKELKSLAPREGLSVQGYETDEAWRSAISNPKGHSGYTKFSTGIATKGQFVQEVDRTTWLSKMWLAAESGTWGKPIVPLHRLQALPRWESEKVVDIKRKTRLVSAVDVNVIMTETMFQQPLQRLVNNCRWYSPGKSPSELRHIIYQDRMHKARWLSLDYSKYDQTIPGWLIAEIFDLIFELFRLEDREKYAAVFSLVKRDFIVKEFLGPEGHVKAVDGVPSGSMFTNLIDSIVNVVMIRTYMFMKRIPMESISFHITGDDNLMFHNGELDSTDISSYILHNFGVVVNTSKSTSGVKYEDPEYLSREWTARGEYRPAHDLVKTLLYPERFRDYLSHDMLPEDIVYALYLTYPVGMKELIRVKEFTEDYRKLRPGLNLNIVRQAMNALGGYAQFKWMSQSVLD